MHKLILCFYLCLIFCTGCWDQIEIEKRGFVTGVGVDSINEKEILLTQQIFHTNSDKENNKGDITTDQYVNISGTGESLFEIVRGVATKTSKTPYYAHLQVFVISEDLSEKKGLGEILDLYVRDHEMRHDALVLISDDMAKDVFQTEAKNEKSPTDYIISISENAYKNAEIFPKTTIGEIHKHLLKKQSFGISLVQQNNGELDLRGAAVIDGRTNKLIGTLDRDGTVGLNFIKGDIEGGFIKARYNEKPFLYEISREKTEINANVKNSDVITFTVNIVTEGALSETSFTKDFTEKETINELEKIVKEEIESKIKSTIQKSQEDFKVDFLDFGEHLRQNHYKIWKSIKDDWDTGKNIYKKCQFNVKVDVFIRNTGSVIKSKD